MANTGTLPRTIIYGRSTLARLYEAHRPNPIAMPAAFPSKKPRIVSRKVIQVSYNRYPSLNPVRRALATAAGDEKRNIPLSEP